jgi:hypothetical protein
MIGKIHLGTYNINKALHLEKDQIKLLLVLDGRDYLVRWESTFSTKVNLDSLN